MRLPFEITLPLVALVIGLGLAVQLTAAAAQERGDWPLEEKTATMCPRHG